MNKRSSLIACVFPPERDSGFYSIIVPKKDGGLRPIFDLQQLNWSLTRYKFEMLTPKLIMTQIRSEGTHFHISILSHYRRLLKFSFGVKRPGYVLKVPTDMAQPIIFQAFCPPPFQTMDQEKQDLLCSVRALDTYVHRAALWRKSDQLLVCFGHPGEVPQKVHIE